MSIFFLGILSDILFSQKQTHIEIESIAWIDTFLDPSHELIDDNAGSVWENICRFKGTHTMFLSLACNKLNESIFLQTRDVYNTMEHYTCATITSMFVNE